MDILEKAQKDGLLFDGAMGTMLIANGIEGGEACERWNLTYPHIIKEIHQAYYDAGADVATANTFGASPIKVKKMGVTETAEAINRAGVRMAKSVCGPDQYVAGDMGSLGDMLQPMGPVSFDEAVACFAQQAGFLEEEGVDCFIIETIFDVTIALAAIQAIRSVSRKPIFCSLTFRQTPNGFFTIFGNRPEESMQALVEAGADAVGANCTVGSRTMIELAAAIRKSVRVPVAIMPNAGMPETTKQGDLFYPEDAMVFAENIQAIKAQGVEIVGGCCGTTPEYIRTIKSSL